jgi:hypothetical protein
MLFRSYPEDPGVEGSASPGEIIFFRADGLAPDPSLCPPPEAPRKAESPSPQRTEESGDGLVIKKKLAFQISNSRLSK